MNILITGAAGFIGTNLIKELLREEHKIIGIDNFNDYYNPLFKIENLKGIKNKNFVLIKSDINNSKKMKKIFNRYKIDKIIHLAASVGVRNSITSPALYRQ